MKNDLFPRGFAFLAGAAVGLGLGMYLNSEKGSALRKQLSDQLDDLLQGLGASAQDRIGDLFEPLSNMLENGWAKVTTLDDQIEDAAENVGDDIREALEEAETNFESGVEKARLRLQEKFAAAGINPKS